MKEVFVKAITRRKFYNLKSYEIVIFKKSLSKLIKR